VSRIDVTISRLGGRWFAPRAQVDSLREEVAALSAANHRAALEIEQLVAASSSNDVAELRRRVIELEALLADLTEQMQRSVTDLLDRTPVPSSDA
jgi:hypothetical protein